jgi:uncharacterized protein (DUF488 family)
VEIYSIGFTKKSAAQFFGTLRQAGIRRLLDVRLNNSSQLAGFTKRGDIEYFLAEICAATYEHEPVLAPTQELLNAYKKQGGSWAEFERGFLALMADRRVEHRVSRSGFQVPTVLLCSEPKPDRCHRRLVAEYLRDRWGDVHIVHL